MSAPVAVTGAGGYVGGRVVQALVDASRPVQPLARRPVPWSTVPTITLDLAVASVDEIAAALDGSAAVVHLAGANEVLASSDPDAALASTITAGRRVAAAARQAGVERLVVLSTFHVYGAAAGPGAAVSTALRPEPRHPYAVARLAVEHLAHEYGPDGLVVLRLTNGIGAPVDRRVDRWSLVANDLCLQAVAGPEVVLRSSGKQWRDFIALADAVDAIVGAADGHVTPGTFDLGSGRPERVLDLAAEVAEVATEVLGRPTAVVAPPHEGPEPEPFTLDVGPLAALGFEARTPRRAALLETLEVCRDQGAG